MQFKVRTKYEWRQLWKGKQSSKWYSHTFLYSKLCFLVSDYILSCPRVEKQYLLSLTNYILYCNFVRHDLCLLPTLGTNHQEVMCLLYTKMDSNGAFTCTHVHNLLTQLWMGSYFLIAAILPHNQVSVFPFIVSFSYSSPSSLLKLHCKELWCYWSR